MVPTVIEGLRRPAYTGGNRCLPCTAVNVAMAAVLAGGLLLVDPRIGVVAFGLALALIYLRGYLVPGTPTLTRRYLPARVLTWFDKRPVGSPAGRADVGEVDPEAELLEHGVVVPRDDGADLELAASFRERLDRHLDHHRTADRSASLADVFAVSPDAVTVRETDRGGVTARVDGRLAGRWESREALLADLAATDALAATVADWEERSRRERSTLAGGVRAVLERCPGCDGRVSIGERTVESCCRSRSVYAVSCADCGARILEVTPPS